MGPIQVIIMIFIVAALAYAVEQSLKARGVLENSVGRKTGTLLYGCGNMIGITIALVIAYVVFRAVTQ